MQHSRRVRTLYRTGSVACGIALGLAIFLTGCATLDGVRDSLGLSGSSSGQTTSGAKTTGSAPRSVTNKITGGEWRSIAAGWYHTVAIKSDGTLWAWGRNGSFQLGDGRDELAKKMSIEQLTQQLKQANWKEDTLINKNKPTQIGTANNWASVAGGMEHTVAIKTDGTLWAWGKNKTGQLGDGTTITKSTPTQIGTANNWAAVAAGVAHTVAIKTDGTLWAWGWNKHSQLGDGTGIDKNTPTQIGAANNWFSIVAGIYHTAAIKTDGTLWVFGNEAIKPTRVGKDNNWESVAVGYQHTVAIKTDGTLWAWGWNGYGQLGDGTNVNKSIPTRIGTANNWASVAAGKEHTVAIQTDGSLWSWGRNGEGQLGDGKSGDVANRNLPLRLGPTNSCGAVTAGSVHTAAIMTDGTIWSWGSNYHGQLGHGSTVTKMVPTPIR